MVSHEDLAVRTLGPCRIDSPLAERLVARETTQHSVVEEDRILFDDTISMAGGRGLPVEELPSLEPGGPRKRIYFDPAKTRVGIVTCGGLCPGLNDVIRGLVLELSRHYGVRRIVGFRNGYRGFIPRYREDVIDLTPEIVANCSIVVRLSDGHITGQFATSPGPDPKPIALTGGTGAYRDIGGEGTLVEFGDETGTLTLEIVPLGTRSEDG